MLRWMGGVTRSDIWMGAHERKPIGCSNIRGNNRMLFKMAREWESLERL